MSACARVHLRTSSGAASKGRKALTFLPAGTSSNEALHAEIKSWFLQTQQIHKSTLRLKLLILTLSKALPHALALQASTISQTNSRLLLARLTAKSVWSPEEWQRWCSSCLESEKVQKACLSFNHERAAEVHKVRTWALKRPSATKRQKQKRTIFTAARRSKLRSQGVRR